MIPNEPVAPSMNAPVVSFPDGFDELAEEEAIGRGLLDNVSVKLADGRQYLLAFLVPIRAMQEASASLNSDPICYAEPNLVMIPEISVGNILRAVERLSNTGYFELLTPSK
jgi:hypothetical protein